MADTLPPDVQLYRRTPSFTAATIPAGLRGEHATKAGVWAVIRVETGALDFEDIGTGETVRLREGDERVVAPASPHRVAPAGEVGFHVDFYR